MDVVFVALRQVIVDDVSDVIDVYTSGNHVSGQKDLDAIVTELLEGALTLTLTLIAVDRGDAETAGI